MTVKRCADCRHLGQMNLPRTGRICHGTPSLIVVVIPIESQATFYCASFQPRPSVRDTEQRAEETTLAVESNNELI